MAYNALYGYDTGLYGYGPANGFASADGAVQPLQRTYPAWMQDINARGIGVDSSNAQPVPAFIGLNSGPLTSATAPAAAAAAPLATAGQQSLQSLNGGSDTGGGGAGNSQANQDNGGYSLGPAPGDLGDIFGLDPHPGDITNASELDADSSSSNPGAQSATDPTSGASVATSNGNFGGVDISADPNGGNANAGGSNTDTSAGGAQAGGEVGSNSEVTGHAKGGIIGRNALMGPNPKGPDSGWGKLEVGEGVLTDKALKHYGKGIVARLNRLEVPKARLRA
jgi:hypothetical protein